MDVLKLANVVKAAAREAGFDICGISAAGEFRELEYFPRWIAEGRAGEMSYLAKRDDQGRLKRSSLAVAAPWARSVVVCAINYNSPQPYSTELTDRSRGWISRYAWTNTDYHETVLGRLREVEAKLIAQASAQPKEIELRTWCYVDTGPVVERVFAQHSGVGWVGKNTCIINQGIGSWLFLGVILTSLDLVPDLPAPDRCGTCRACLDACPTNAFIAPYQLDATKCISYLTIEKRGEIPEELREGMGRNIFGCDICQDVCPWNREAPVGRAPEFAPREGLQAPSLKWMAEMTVDEFRETFRHSPVKRAKFSGLKRNTAIAMGNSGNLEFAGHLRKLAEDDDESVAEHARWALGELERRRHLGEDERTDMQKSAQK
jgi:epoxyqueuosine reductase